MLAGSHQLWAELRKSLWRLGTYREVPFCKPRHAFAPWSLFRCNHRLNLLFRARQGLSAQFIGLITPKLSSVLYNPFHHCASTRAHFKGCRDQVLRLLAVVYLQLQHSDGSSFPMLMVRSLFGEKMLSFSCKYSGCASMRQWEQWNLFISNACVTNYALCWTFPKSPLKYYVP